MKFGFSFKNGYIWLTIIPVYDNLVHTGLDFDLDIGGELTYVDSDMLAQWCRDCSELIEEEYKTGESIHIQYTLWATIEEFIRKNF